MLVARIIVIIFCGLLIAANPTIAQTWTQQTNSPAEEWTCIASSADGSKLVAASFNGPVYTSSDSGVTWIEVTNAPGSEWIAVVSSADGIKLVALNIGGSINSDDAIIYSSNDSGTTWTNIYTPSVTLNCMALSADGTTLVAGDWNDFGGPSLIYCSTNFGITWITNNAPSEYWTSIASSTDGTKFVAGCVNPDSTGTVFVSHDSGMTWNATDLPFASWQAVASSADGSELVAAASGGLVYTSTNSGTTWMTSNIPTTFWSSVASSVDGRKLVAVNTYGSLNDGGVIYTSSDFGLSWASNDVPNDVSWQAIVSSADGNRLAVATFDNSIYTFYSTPLPQLNLSSSNGTLNFSWFVPSTNFVLQQSSDLANWVTLTNQPTLNFTNLNDELVLPQTNNSGFFQLISQ